MKELKFSVSGFVRIGQHHAKIVNEFDGTKLVSVMDVETPEFENTQPLGLNVEPYHSIDEFLANDNSVSEIVCIATPNGFHTEYPIRCLK